MFAYHLIIIYYKGQYHIAQHAEFNGYPEKAGLSVLRFVSCPDNIAALNTVLSNAAATLYEPTQAQLSVWYREMLEVAEAHDKIIDAATDNAEYNELLTAGPLVEAKVCPSVHLRTGAGILEIVKNATEEKPVPVQKSLWRIADCEFCEWLYVIDLDANALEVYNDKPVVGVESEGESRFKSVKCLRGAKLPSKVGTFVFSDLPNEADFVKRCRE